MIKRKAAERERPTVVISTNTQNGYTLHWSKGTKGDHTIEFELGETFTQTDAFGRKVESVVEVVGSCLVESQVSEGKRSEVKMERSGGELILRYFAGSVTATRVFGKQ
jgi:hypothetical protein